MRWTKRRLGKAVQRRREHGGQVFAQGSETDQCNTDATKKIALQMWAPLAVAALSAVATCLQWWEIHSSNEDTHALAVAAGKQATAAERQLAVMNASQRAWVGPTNAFISGAVELGKPVTVYVNIVNTGREPATSVRILTEPLAVAFSAASDSRSFISKCFLNVDSPRGHVLYPTGSSGAGTLKFQTTFSADKIDQDVIEGRTMLLTRGCITYETLTQTKNAAFCYYYQNGVVTKDSLNVCRVGSDAD